MIQSSPTSNTSSRDCHPPRCTARPAGCILLRDKYVQILVLTASPPAAEGKVWLCCRSRAQIKSVCPRRPGYADGPELCEVGGWARGALLGGPGVAATVGGAGGEPVWTCAWNWAICSGLASVFSRVFSCSSWELRSISSLICSFRTSTSSRTAYIRWLFTRSWDRQTETWVTY